MAAIVQTNDSFFDIWRKIPPEEKLEIMARAQSKGIAASTVLLTATGSMAVGLRMPWIFYGAFVIVPFVFQFASAKAWRDLKPRAMLEYLAARSAARRYAYGAQSKDLSVVLLFKATLQQQFDNVESEEALEARIAHKDRVDVWVALFPDTVVMMSERVGGAKLEFATVISSKFEVVGEGFDEYGASKRLLISYETKRGDKFRYALTSPYPATLLVFERKVRFFIAEAQAQAERDAKAYREMFKRYGSSEFNEEEEE